MNRRKFLKAASVAALASPSVHAQGGIALVLGGGGCRGYGHLGVIRVLQRHSFKPDLVVGTSAGSLVGALYAAGLRAEEIERYGQNLSPNLMRGWIFPKLGIFSGRRIRRFVEDRVGKGPMQSMPIRFAAVATDLRNGERVILDRGDVGLAVQASSSAPGLLEPVRVGKRLLVDGNLVAPVPVDAARRLGAGKVLAVDVSFPPEQADLADPYDALYQGFSILTRRLAVMEGGTADLLIAPALPEHHDMSGETLAALIAAGEKAALQKLAELKALFKR